MKCPIDNVEMTEIGGTVNSADREDVYYYRGGSGRFLGEPIVKDFPWGNTHSRSIPSGWEKVGEK